MTRRLILFQAAYLRCLKGPLWKTFRACLIVPSSKTVSGDEYQQLFAKSEVRIWADFSLRSCSIAAAKLQCCWLVKKVRYKRSVETSQRRNRTALCNILTVAQVSLATSSDVCNLFVSEQWGCGMRFCEAAEQRVAEWSLQGESSLAPC